jgi:hypothetical protein
MTREELREEVLSLPVWDTHTHLIGDGLAAKTFWDIGHYFWFLRELRAAGYPADYADLPEEQRAEAYAKAFNTTRNTSMNWVVRSIFESLYKLEITGAASIMRADEAVRDTAEDSDWPKQVIERLAVRRIVVNNAAHADFEGLPGVSYVLPRIESLLRGWRGEIADAPDQRAAGDEVAEKISAAVEELRRSGVRGIMASQNSLCARTHDAPDELAAAGNSEDTIGVFVLHALCRAAEKHGLFLQFFLGMEPGWSSQSVPYNRTERIVALHGLFDRYECPFELVLATELSNLDAVQAARVFPNVRVGGLWWFNFRASTYRQCMQYRLEALPPSKSAFVASDARCVEWCYGKILLIKRLMADFLFDQVELGWLDHGGALWVAREWLYGAAASLYVDE